MAYDPDRHDRRSMRLPDYDYRAAGAYFVTICTHERRLLFGEVVRGRMRLSPCGRVAAEEWHRTAEVRARVELDAFVVMPNHVHGILLITSDASDERRDTMHRVPTTGETPTDDKNAPRRAFGDPKAGSLSTIVGMYKAAVTRRCRREHRADFAWQGRFYDHVIRGRKDLRRIRQYIADNPARGFHDRLHR